MLNFDDAQHDPAASHPELVACAFALGQLDGRLHTLSPADEAQVAATTVYRTLAGALGDAGYAEADAALSRWLLGGTPPLGEANAVLGAATLTHVVLHCLQRASWPALASCAGVLRRASPQLAAPSPATAGELTEAWSVLAQAQVTLCHGPADRVSTTLCRLAEHACTAGDMPIFARGQADLATLDTPWGRRTYHRAPPRPHSWALNLIAGDALHCGRLLGRAMPLRGSILIGALRVDLTQSERQTILYQGLTASVRNAVRMVESCRRRQADQSAALVHLRSTSRAPAILAVLAGVGPLTRRQIARGFCISRQGVDGIVNVLEAAGLVRCEHRAVRATTWAPTEIPVAQPLKPLAPLSGIAEFDDALAALDTLLARTDCHNDSIAE